MRHRPKERHIARNRRPLQPHKVRNPHRRRGRLKLKPQKFDYSVRPVGNRRPQGLPLARKHQKTNLARKRHHVKRQVRPKLHPMRPRTPVRRGRHPAQFKHRHPKLARRQHLERRKPLPPPQQQLKTGCYLLLQKLRNHLVRRRLQLQQQRGKLRVKPCRPPKPKLQRQV